MRKRIPVFIALLFIALVAIPQTTHAASYRHSHRYVKTTIPATCTTDGWKGLKCKTCGKEIKTEKLKKLGHKYETTKKNATCAEAGYKVRKCTRTNKIVKNGITRKVVCGHEAYSTYIPKKTTHSWGKWKTEVEANCTTKKKDVNTCKVCGAVTVRYGNKNKDKHLFKKFEISPTCTKQGYTALACVRCNTTKTKYAYTKALGHDMTEWVEAADQTNIATSKNKIKLISGCKRYGCKYYETRWMNDERRIDIVKTAHLGYLKRIPYYWGGHPDCAGYAGNNFGKKITADYKGRTKKGLDCGGLVCWAYWTAGLGNFGNGNTADIWKQTEPLKDDVDLLPGDLGFIGAGKNSTHIGIYAGSGRWIHATGDTGGNRVVMSRENPGFEYYRRAKCFYNI